MTYIHIEFHHSKAESHFVTNNEHGQINKEAYTPHTQTISQWLNRPDPGDFFF